MRGLRPYLVSRLGYFWINHPTCDFLLLALGIGLQTTGAVDLGSDLDLDGRRLMYQTLAAVLAGIVGIAIAAITLVVTLTPGARFLVVLRTVGDRLNRLLFSSVSVLVAIAFFNVMAILLDSETAPKWIWASCRVLMLLATLRTLRLMWLFRRVAHIFASDALATDIDKPTEWMRPELSEQDYLLRQRDRKPVREMGC